uniref:Uncharacterized protein n=1 Tax=Romanomermis culicivorax TaxID=13658 RepID=A0A915KAT5_ROMCU
MPLHTPYCAESDFCVCWMESQRRGLRDRKEASVAVIGAGFAGLSVADQLINRYGFKNVTVYEALDRIGGRAHSVRFGEFDRICGG